MAACNASLAAACAACGACARPAYECARPGLTHLTPGLFAGTSASFLSYATDISAPGMRVRAREFEACTGGKILILDANSAWEDPIEDVGTPSAEGPGIYDGYLMSYSHFPELSALRLAETLNDRIATDNEQLQYQDFFASVQRMGSYRRDGKVDIDFLMYDGDFFVPVVRLDLMEKYNQSIPNTWEELVDFARFFDGQDLNDDGEADFGFCHFPQLEGEDWIWWWPELIYSTWATYAKPKDSNGFFFDPLTFEPRLDTPGFREAARLWKDLWRLGGEGCISDNFNTGRCAIGYSPPGCWKTTFLHGVARRDANGTVVWRPTFLDGQYAEPYRLKPFGTTQVMDPDSGSLVECTKELCSDIIPARGHTGTGDRANPYVKLSPLAGQYINRAPFFWSGGLGTLIRRSATPKRKDLIWAFFVYTNSPATSVPDVGRYASWLDSWRHSQLTAEGRSFVNDSTWSRQAYNEHRAIMTWALSNSGNGALNLRVPGAKEYTHDALSTWMFSYIDGSITLDRLVSTVTADWRGISSRRGKLNQLDIYRASVLFTDPLTERQKCAHHRSEMEDRFGVGFCIKYDQVISCPSGFIVKLRESGADCEPCAVGSYELDGQCLDCSDFIEDRANCSKEGLSMETLLLKPGYWRHSNTTMDIKRCVRSHVGTTPCTGALQASSDDTGSSLCVAGTTGPLCQLCSVDGTYFHKAQAMCTECPDAAVRIGSLLGVATGILFLLASAHRLLMRQRTLSMLNLSVTGQQIFALVFKDSALGLKAKLKVIFAFYQILFPLSTTYSVPLPDDVQQFLENFEWVNFDLSDFTLPVACFAGGMRSRILLAGVLPWILILVLFLMSVLAFMSWSLTSRVQHTWRISLTHGLGIGANLGLFVTFVFVPSVSSAIFRAWACSDFEYDYYTQTHRQYLKADLSVRCSFNGYTNDEHEHLKSIGWVFVAVWPIGVLVLYMALLVPCRGAIRSGQSSWLSRATAFLHREYRPEWYLWEAADLVRRTVLTGWVLLIPETESHVRIMVAIIISLIYLIAILIAKPFRRESDNALAVLTHLQLVLIFVAASWIYSYGELEALGTGSGYKLLGFHSDRALVDFVLIAFISCLVFFGVFLCMNVISVVRRARDDEKWALFGTAKIPIAHLQRQEEYAAFLCHSKQDAGTDARLMYDILRRMLRAPLFLDSSNLRDLRELLSHGVASSAVLIVLCTPGLFVRPWCLLEMFTAFELKVPVLFVNVVGRDFDFGQTFEMIRHLCDRLPSETLAALEELSIHLPPEVTRFDLNKLEVALRRIFDAQTTPLLNWSPNQSDSHIIAEVKMIANAMAQSLGRVLSWRRDHFGDKNQTAVRRRSVSRHCIYIVFCPLDCAADARLLRSMLMMRGHNVVLSELDGSGDNTLSESFLTSNASSRCNGEEGRNGLMAERLASCGGVIVLLSRHLLESPMQLSELFLSSSFSKTIITIKVEGRGFDFDIAKRSVANLPASCIDKLQELVGPSCAMEMVQMAIMQTIMNIIAVPWDPNLTQEHLTAMLNEIIVRLPQTSYKHGSLRQGSHRHGTTKAKSPAPSGSDRSSASQGNVHADFDSDEPPEYCA